MLFTPIALVAASISSGDDGRSNRISVWFFDGCVAMEARAGVDRGEPWSVKACAAAPCIALRLSDPYWTRSPAVVVSGIDGGGICRCLVNTCSLER